MEQESVLRIPSCCGICTGILRTREGLSSRQCRSRCRHTQQIAMEQFSVVLWRLVMQKGPNFGSPSWHSGMQMRICEERHVTVEGSESSYVSFDRVDDP